ncbi:hypothetical protein Sjap_015342 [Stephania japonica]|uniref:IP5PC-F beta-propeller domain-containing protein n=1 Tax=Stephania japonica TaxID=461633 RepID=A0AAP0NSS4_9MAGN
MEKFHEEGLEVTSLKEEWELISDDKSEPADKKPLVSSISVSQVYFNPFYEGICAHLILAFVMDARSRELLKVFNVDGQIENRVDLSTKTRFGIEDEMKVKFVSSSKKEKSQGFSFFQRLT